LTVHRTATFNLWLLVTTLAIGGLGLVNLYSASKGAPSNLALLQGLWLGVGVVLALVLTALDYRIFEQLAYPLLGLTLVALLVVLVAGRIISGSQRWIHLGFFNFQPSEIAKITVVLALAKYFSDEARWPADGFTLMQLIKPASILYPLGTIGALILFWEHIALGDWRFVILGVCLIWAAASFLYGLRTGRTSLHDLLSPVILVVLPAILILRQPDLGTTLVLFAVAGTIILFVKVRLVSLVIVGTIMAACTTLVLVAVSSDSWEILEAHQKRRILAFLYPEEASRDDRYQADQSIIAIGSGRISGKGFGESTQTQLKFLPKQHTDFVFSVWAEEWGFVGCLVVLGLFLFWLVLIVNVATTAREKFGVLIGVGIAALVFWHVAINIGMVIGILPVVGLTLPLWSYGGSSVQATMIGVGLVLSISLRRHTF
jgi:rod shape determining protein RodA